jgi:L-malate glycosyltransferase
MARELDLGGSERQLAETAKSLDRTLFEVHVGCFRPAGMRGDELRDAGITVAHFPVHSYRSLSAVREAWHLARYIHQNNIRIVHTWDYPLTVYAIPIARLMTSAKAVSSQRSHRELIPRGYLQLNRLADRLSHAIVANCEYIRRHLVEDEHVPAEKIRVCYNGIDLKRFYRTARPAGNLTIGTVCALRPEKDLTVLIDAFAQVCPTQPGLTLIVVGSGSELPLLRKWAAEAGVADRCHFEPATARVPEWLSAIDIFVLPSRSEAFSNSLMEALACGCCVISSDVGGNPELVRDGETGLHFRQGDAASLADALRRVLLDSDLRRQLASNGERWIRGGFSTEAAASRMAEIYHGVLGHAG